MEARKATFNVDWNISIAMPGIVIGITMWAIGAKYTVDGKIWLFNWFAEFLRSDTRIIPTSDWYLYLLIIPIIYSFFEWAPPSKFKGNTGLLIVWAAIHVFDFFSTLLGLIAINVHIGFAVILTLVLSYLPEYIIKSCVAVFRKAVSI